MQSVEFPPSLDWLWRATRVIAVSEFVKRKLVATGLPADRISVVYNGVDTQKFQPRAAERHTLRTQFGLPPDAFLVLMVARLTVQKRHDLALEAAAQALSRVPNLHLVFVAPFGFPELRGILNARIHSLGLGGKVTWLPFQEDIRQIELAADVLILPSDHEASGICVIEAMAVQVPVVVSDSGGSHELLEHEVSGLVVPGGDAAALADSLARLALDPELAAKLVRNGRRRVESLFSLERYANAVAAILRPLSDHALQ
jgi:glycosyltransferase involved in cell wall biosynthesis